MTEFSRAKGRGAFNQPPTVTCVEFDRNTNFLRHHLAEIVFDLRGRRSNAVLSMCHALTDFGEVMPREDRTRLQKQLQCEEENYFDETTGEWLTEPQYSEEEANYIAQLAHRYRLVVFSNFLTTVGAVSRFETNLIEILEDARPGSVILLLGGKKDPYPSIYSYVDQLAKAANFEIRVEDEKVSSAETEIANLIFDARIMVYKHLYNLAPDTSGKTEVIMSQRAPLSHIRAYRK
jgi:hypothetical protein